MHDLGHWLSPNDNFWATKSPKLWVNSMPKCTFSCNLQGGCEGDSRSAMISTLAFNVKVWNHSRIRNRWKHELPRHPRSGREGGTREDVMTNDQRATFFVSRRGKETERWTNFAEAESVREWHAPNSVQAIPKRIYKVSTFMSPLLHLPAKMSGKRNMWILKTETL